MEQTAINWLIEKLNQCEPWYSGLDESTSKHINQLIDIAKEREQYQIIEAFNAGQAKEATDVYWTKGESYYEEHYG